MCRSFSDVEGNVAGVLTEDKLFAKLCWFGYMDAALSWRWHVVEGYRVFFCSKSPRLPAAQANSLAAR